MKKQFATYKISSAIRELGFDEECIAWYNSSSEDSLSMCDVFGLLVDKCSEDFIKNSDGEYVTAPLWSQVIDWLLLFNKGSLCIVIDETPYGHYGHYELKYYYTIKRYGYKVFESDVYYLDRNKAREQAILKAIKIIKKKKSDETNN